MQNNIKFSKLHKEVKLEILYIIFTETDVIKKWIFAKSLQNNY